MPRSWGSEPYDVPADAPEGAQAWAPPAGMPAPVPLAPAVPTFAPYQQPLPAPQFGGPVVGVPVVGVPAYPGPAVPPPYPGYPTVPPAYSVVPGAPGAGMPAPVVVPGHLVPAFPGGPLPAPALFGPARWAGMSALCFTVVIGLGTLLDLALRARLSWAHVEPGGYARVLQVLVAFATLAAMATAWGTASAWLRCAVLAAQSREPRAVPYPIWFSWGAWVVPIANLVLPMFLVRDVWRVAGRGRPRYLQPKVGGWWALWIASAVLRAVDNAVAGTAPGLTALTTTTALVSLAVTVLALRAWWDVLDGATQAFERPRDEWTTERIAQGRIPVWTGRA